MKKIGIILSGCGFLDGSEIHEAVLTLLAIDRAGARAFCFAPDTKQHHVINHYTREETIESRNVLVESARIARGSITDLSAIDPHALDALIIPGGYGAAKNLSSYAHDGASCSVNPDVAAAVQSFYNAAKPIGFICIAPVIAAKILGEEHIDLTIGNDLQTARDIEAMGAHHIESQKGEALVSRKGKVVSTPAYMMETTIADVARGIDKLVEEVISLTA